MPIAPPPAVVRPARRALPASCLVAALAAAPAHGHNVVERQAMGDIETIAITPSGFDGYADQRDANGTARGY